MQREDTPWHPEVLPKESFEVLTQLASKAVLLPFYLAGGTALALQWGHRTSVDLDFFSSDTFSEEVLISALQPLHAMHIISKAPETLHLHAGTTKVSFLGYHYPVLFDLIPYSGIQVAD